MYILIWIISGIVAGWLTGIVMRGRGFGLLGDLIIGLLGGLLGGWLFGLLGIVATSLVGQVIIAFLGGVVLVAIVRALRRV
ncbi:MAG: GlsB/YeaQ/YmgE family stress response membrane protein [Anaerolineae bacterium]